jgi:hypothetical protein
MVDQEQSTHDDTALDEVVVLSEKPSRWPSVLVGVTTILAVLAVFTLWGRTQALDSDEWVDLSTELLNDPEVQQALATYLVEALYEDGEVTAGLEENLPQDLKGLAGPLAGALRGPLTDGVEQLIASDAVAVTWEEANRIAHQTLVAILRDETREGISTADGVVAIELKPLVVTLAESIGLSGDRIDALPDDAGRIVLFESDELDTVQQAVKVLDFTAWATFVAVILLYTLAVYLAAGRRIDLLRQVGWSLMGVGAVVLIARTIAVRTLVNVIVEDPAGRPVADRVGLVVTALLRQMGWTALLYGVIIVAFTSLLGDHRRVVAIRRTLAPALNASTGAVVGGTAVLILLLMWWNPGAAFEGWTTGLTLIALIIGAVTTLRIRTRNEFNEQPLVQ